MVTLARSYIGMGTAGQGTTAAVTYALPTGIAAGDFLYLVVEAPTPKSITNQNGGTWNLVGSYAVTGTSITLWESKYNGTQGNVTVGADTDHQCGRIVAYQGAAGDGYSAIDGYVIGGENTSDTSWSIDAITTVHDFSSVLTFVVRSDDSASARFSNWTNASLLSISERLDGGTANGNGGGYALMDGYKAVAGTTNATTVTNATATTKAWIVLALSQIEMNGTLVNATRFGGSAYAESTGLTLPSPAAGITFSCWCRAETDSTPFSFGRTADSFATINVYFDTGNVTLYDYRSGDYNGNPFAAALNTWVYIVVKMTDATHISLGYITTPGGALTWASEDVTISAFAIDGCNVGLSAFAYFTGSAEYFTVHASALSNEAIIANSATPDVSGAYIFLKLELGNAATDYSGNGRNFTVYGTPTSSSTGVFFPATGPAEYTASLSETVTITEDIGIESSGITPYEASVSETVTIGESINVVGGEVTPDGYTIRYLTRDSTGYDMPAWPVGNSVIVVDGYTGDIINLANSSATDATLIRTSQDGGVTFSSVGTAVDFLSCEMLSVCQTSDGNLHAIANVQGSLTYGRMSLTRSGGHITGRTVVIGGYGTSGAFPAISGDAFGMDSHPEIKVVRDGNSTEKLLVTYMASNGGSGFVSHACISANITPTDATSSWYDLSGNANAWTNLGSSTTITAYQYQIRGMQNEASGDIYFVRGPAQTGDSDDANVDRPIEYARVTQSGSNWSALSSWTHIASRENASGVENGTGTLYTPMLMCVYATADSIIVMRQRPSTGVEFDRINADGTLTASYVAGPWNPGLPTSGVMTGVFTASRDNSKIWAMVMSYSPSIVVNWMLYSGSEWQIVRDPISLTLGSDFPASQGTVRRDNGLIVKLSPRQGIQSDEYLGSITSDSTLPPQEYTADVTESVMWEDYSSAALHSFTSVAESIAASDALAASRGMLLNLSESITVSDSAILSASGKPGVTESWTWSDSSTSTFLGNTSLNESVIIFESRSASFAATQALSETVTLSEVLAPVYAVGIALAESISLSDGYTSDFQNNVLLSDSITLGENIGADQQGQGAFSADITESITLSEDVTISFAASQVLSESISISDVGVGGRQISIPLNESWTVSEGVVVQLSSIPLLTESLVYIESIATNLSSILSLAESVTLTEDITASQGTSQVADVSESWTWSESLAGGNLLSVSVADSIVWNEALTTAAALTLAIGESFSVTDLISILQAGGKPMTIRSLPIRDSSASLQVRSYIHTLRQRDYIQYFKK